MSRDAGGPRWPVVVFDLDGTLVDSINVIVVSYQHVFATISNRQVGREEALSWIGQTLRETFLREDSAHADILEHEYRVFNEARMPQLLTGFAGINELLDELRAAGVTTGIATSKRRGAALKSMQIAGLPGYADLTVAMEDTDVHKPHPRPLQLALERIGAKASEAVYVGDAIYDLQAAQRAGMDGVGVTWGAGSPAALAAQPAAAVVDTVGQLRTVLLG